MQIMRPTEADAVIPGGLDPDVSYAVIETDEEEQIILQGASQAEVNAKIHDFLHWAS